MSAYSYIGMFVPKECVSWPERFHWIAGKCCQVIFHSFIPPYLQTGTEGKEKLKKELDLSAINYSPHLYDYKKKRQPFRYRY